MMLHDNDHGKTYTRYKTEVPFAVGTPGWWGQGASLPPTPAPPTLGTCWRQRDPQEPPLGSPGSPNAPPPASPGSAPLGRRGGASGVSPGPLCALRRGTKTVVIHSISALWPRLDRFFLILGRFFAPEGFPGELKSAYVIRVGHFSAF